MANSEDPDEMQLIAAFHQGLHCLLRLKQPSGSKIHSNLETTTTCDPSKYKWAIQYLLYQYVWENPSEYKGLFSLQPLLARHDTPCSAYFDGFKIIAVSFITKFSFLFCCLVFDINQLKVKFADHYAITKTDSE